MKLIKKICVLLIVVFFIPSHTNAKWKFVSPMPNERYGHDATLGLDGKVYVMGGMVFKKSMIRKYNDGQYSSLVYNPKEDQWRILEPVPGWIKRKNRYLIYDQQKDQWDSIKISPDNPVYYEVTAPLKRKGQIRKIPPDVKLRNTTYERQGDGVAIVTAKDGRIYWIGGNGRWGGYGEDIILPYDSAKARWPEAVSQRKYTSFSVSSSGSGASWRRKTVFKTKIPPMSERRIDHEAVVTAAGKIFVMGGRQLERFEDSHGNVTSGDFLVLDTIECYDPATNKWGYRKPMTVKRFLFAAVVGPDDKIYTFGGGQRMAKDGRRPVFDLTEVYDPKTDSWQYRAPMPKPRFAHSGVLGADNRIYIIGGSGGSRHHPPTRDVFIYDPVNDSWDTGPSMNIPRSTLAAVATPDGKIYAIGGTDVGAYKNKQKLNFFLPEKTELYTGMVQDTIEVLDVFRKR